MAQQWRCSVPADSRAATFEPINLLEAAAARWRAVFVDLFDLSSELALPEHAPQPNERPEVKVLVAKEGGCGASSNAPLNRGASWDGVAGMGGPRATVHKVHKVEGKHDIDPLHVYSFNTGGRRGTDRASAGVMRVHFLREITSGRRCWR